MLQSGFATRCITPPPGRDIPGLFERRIAEGTNDDLYARAAVVDDGQHCVAMVQVDAIKVSEDLVSEARAEAARLCGIAPGSCFIGATHTHSGGPVFGGFMSEVDPEYIHFVAEQIAAAISEAHRVMRPAMAGTGTGVARGVAFNRRFLMKDGSQKTHPGKQNPDILEPAGPEDTTVTVIGLRSPDDLRPFGCIVSFACHGTHMNGYLYSADYPRWVIDTLKGVYGPEFGVVFLLGACGDVTQVDNRNPRPTELGPYWCERTGRVVGAAAVQALARMDYFSDATVAAGSTKIRVDLRAATREDCAAARELLAHKAITPEDVETIYANELLMVEKMRRKKPTRSIEITGVRVADAWLWGVPAEFFQALAMDLRAVSPFPLTCCVELANGYNGYICTREAFSGGGYEIRTARSSLLEVGAGEKVVRAAKNLAVRMYRDAMREIEALPGRRTWPVYKDSALDGINQLSKK